MIINELVSNSLKHAFPSNTNGEIYISLNSKNNKEFILIVSDNGIGIPQAINYKNTKTLGLQLVCNLTDQLGGTIELDRNQGTEFIIRLS
jgi:two-component sensor histidine kinase